MSPHISWIVDEHAPFPEVLPPPVIAHVDASGGGGGVPTPQLQSPPACKRQVVRAVMLESPPGLNAGVKHETGVPPPLTQLIAEMTALLQVQSCAQASNCISHPFSMHPQHCWNDGAIMKSTKLGEHGPDDPEDPPLDPVNPPDALDPTAPLDVLDPANPPDALDPTVPLELTPLDPTPLDPTPLDPTPLDATPPEEDPAPPELTPLEENWLPDEPPLPPPRSMSLRPQPSIATMEARSPIRRRPARISELSFRGRSPALRSPSS